jgi:alkanesulfonate monooxygenase SsuD/methylene tetrahydromethanopterin reductase-like flavin-dependent oxidoreductase (luciferase family)
MPRATTLQALAHVAADQWGLFTRRQAEQAAIGNRLTLGIGPGHKQRVEHALGVSFDRPAGHTREYLTALMPLLRGEPVEFHGRHLHVAGQVRTPEAQPPSVLLAALGPDRHPLRRIWQRAQLPGPVRARRRRGGADVAVVGDERHVERQLRRFAEEGATEFIAVPFGAPEQIARTLHLLGQLNQTSIGIAKTLMPVTLDQTRAEYL